VEGRLDPDGRYARDRVVVTGSKGCGDGQWTCCWSESIAEDVDELDARWKRKKKSEDECE
jgi:hypothetical protein